LSVLALRFDARVLTARRATVIRRLALMNPSTLAQIIPATRQKQNAWLQALQNWCERMASRSEVNNYRCMFFEWAATNYPGVTYTEANGVHHVVDFVRAQGAHQNPETVSSWCLPSHSATFEDVRRLSRHKFFNRQHHRLSSFRLGNKTHMIGTE
jgi:hypothetical protein